MLKPIIQYGIGKAKKSKFVQNLFEAPFDLSKFSAFDEFTDSYGNRFELLDGLRTKIKAKWNGLNDKQKYDFSAANINTLKSNGAIAVERLRPILAANGKDITQSTILEVGCHAGAVSLAFAECGAKAVVGSEFSGYKVASLEKENVCETQLQQVNEELAELRAKLAEQFKNADRVSFVDDDISFSRLPANTFDIICSWDVLEHLHEPSNAFSSMTQLLKDGGIMVHEYNPFFCLNGGHSLCTLDFLWGHARLNEADFDRYVAKFRPNEAQWASSFFSEGLNRMTLHDLDGYLCGAGLETLAILPFVKEQHVRMVDEATIKQVQNLYPSARLTDLVSPRVLVIARKKE